MIDFVVTFYTVVNETTQALEGSFLVALNGTLAGSVAVVRLTGFIMFFIVLLYQVAIVTTSRQQFSYSIVLIFVLQR